MNDVIKLVDLSASTKGEVTAAVTLTSVSVCDICIWSFVYSFAFIHIRKLIRVACFYLQIKTYCLASFSHQRLQAQHVVLVLTGPWSGHQTGQIGNTIAWDVNGLIIPVALKCLPPSPPTRRTRNPLRAHIGPILPQRLAITSSARGPEVTGSFREWPDRLHMFL